MEVHECKILNIANASNADLIEVIFLPKTQKALHFCKAFSL